MSKQRKNRFDNIQEVKVEDAESLLDAGKSNASNTVEPLIDLSSLNTDNSKPLTRSYSSTGKHEEMLQEMIDESKMQDKSKFMRYMIETFYKMTRKK